MPYVRRNGKGKIIGASSASQTDHEEFLSDDNIEIAAFYEVLRAEGVWPPPTITEKDLPGILQTIREVESELDGLKAAILSFNQTFHEFELALSSLLYVALNVEPRSSRVAYAIYYSPTSFDARADIVDNVLQQLIRENKPLAPLQKVWAKLHKKFGATRAMRNALAHGMPKNFAIGGKNHARLSSPVFDVIRVGRRIEDGHIPGLCTGDILEGRQRALWLRKCVDEVKDILEVSRDEGNVTLPKKFATLEDSLKMRDRS